MNLETSFFLLNYENEWLEKINQLPKLRLYKSIKTNLKTENYLEMNISKSQRSFMAQSRYFQLELKRGDKKGKRLDERICIFVY